MAGCCLWALSTATLLDLGAGVLEETGAGLPFVLKRTDGGHPEWMKKQHHHDFFLDLSQVRGLAEWPGFSQLPALHGAAKIARDW